ncbi:hypothetical protein KBZ15_13220 [Cyanobium sp. BA20m-p-22]|uniref:DUF4351 domain-containing protein n=1 Tax=Cyanobium sp. BA20m-p-22 TaxID=2823704 RepID=UPI0020CEFC9B|nr:DUF4351 domain-containing protein [Cyanobium sp. BA20m-p-22]MCP9910852.1 hypothetical protein [Cyanobium sp. BA20m-p-22]
MSDCRHPPGRNPPYQGCTKLACPGEAKVTLCQPNRRCGHLSEATAAQILGLLDFQGPADLASWLAGNA